MMLFDCCHMMQFQMMMFLTVWYVCVVQQWQKKQRRYPVKLCRTNNFNYIEIHFVKWLFIPLCFAASPLCEKFPSSGCFQFIRSQLSARNRVNVGVVPGASQLFRWRLLLLSMGNSGIRMMRNLIGSQSAVSQLGKLLQGWHVSRLGALSNGYFVSNVD